MYDAFYLNEYASFDWAAREYDAFETDRLRHVYSTLNDAAEQQLQQLHQYSLLEIVKPKPDPSVYDDFDGMSVSGAGSVASDAMSTYYDLHGDSPPTANPALARAQSTVRHLGGVHTFHEQPLPVPSADAPIDWNGELQRLLEMPALTPGLAKERTQKIADLMKLFQATQTEVAKTIIRETFAQLPNEAREVPSVDLGGLAGGEKFEKDGVIFKFARDSTGLYGDDATAAKVAKLELLGLSSMIEENIAGLHFPLQAVVDYIGQRIVATARIPVNQTTIRYGSNDGGKTVHNDASFEGLMAELAGKFHLKAHRVKDKLLWTAGDVEGHQGLDGRRYVLDTARTFPPVAPASEYLALLIAAADAAAPYSPSLELVDVPVAGGMQPLALLLGAEPQDVIALPTQVAQTVLLCSRLSDAPNEFAAQFVVPQLQNQARGVCLLLSTPPKSAHLVRLFRPEFMRRLPASLSADAFTGWGRQDCDEHNAEVAEATSVLLMERIAEAAEILQRRWESEDPLTYKAIEAEVHAQGVNFCFLGRVRARVRLPALRRALLGIMIARTFRKTVEREVRTIYKAAIVSTAHEIAQHTLGLFQHHMLYQDELLAQYPHSPTHQALLKAQLHGRYPEALTLEEWSSSVDLWADLGEPERLKAFVHAQSLLGLKIQFGSVTFSAGAAQQAGARRLEVFEIQEVSAKCAGMKPPRLLAEASVDLAVVEQTYRRELEMRQQALPPAHPSVLTVRMHLLGIYSMRGGTYDVAKQVFEQAWAAVTENEAEIEANAAVIAALQLHWGHFLHSQGRMREALCVATAAMNTLSELAESLAVDHELRSLLHDSVVLSGAVLVELGQFAVAIPILQQLLDELQEAEDPSEQLTLRKADVITELQVLVTRMGRADQNHLVINYRNIDTYRARERTGYMYGRCLVAAAYMEAAMGFAPNAVGTMYTAISSFKSDLSHADRRLAMLYYLRAAFCMNVHMLGDAVVHFHYAQSLLAQLNVTEPLYVVPLLADYAKCLFQLAKLLQEQTREQGLHTKDMMTTAILEEDQGTREYFARLELAEVVSSYESMLAQLEVLRDSLDDAVGPCPPILKGFVTAADLCLELERTETADAFLRVACQGAAAMQTLASLPGSSSADVNGDPLTELELATVLAKRGAGYEQLTLRIAQSAANKAARLLGPENSNAVRASKLLRQLVLAKKLEPLLAMGFERSLCEAALELTNFDAEAAAALLLDGDALREQIAIAKFEKTGESRQEWVLSMRVFHPDTCQRLRTAVANILKQPEEIKFRRLRVSNAVVFQHFISVKDAFEYLQALGFEKKRDDSGEEMLILEYPCKDVLARAHAELQAVLQLSQQDASRQLQSTQDEALGKAAIDNACLALYPDQPDTIQFTAKIKYWLGGPDPLDYISVYRNPGDRARNIPEHWHYISYGFSDLYGDGRSFHAPTTGREGPSGYGYEVTFRLGVLPGEKHPPVWPAVAMNRLGNYFIRAGARIDEGHYLQHTYNDCARPHAIVVTDPQLGMIATPHGSVHFLQLVAVADADIEQVQAWSSREIANLYRRFPDMGGEWLVADRSNGTSLLEAHPEVARLIDEGIARDGSSAGFVTSYFAWFPREDADFPVPLESVRIVVDPLTTRALVVALRGRIPHGYPFSLNNEAADGGELAQKGVRACRMLLVTDGVDSCPTWDAIYASAEVPFVRVNGGHDIQIHLTVPQAAAIAEALTNDVLKPGSVLPRLFVFPDIVPGLQILVDDQEVVKTLNGLPGDEREFQSFLSRRIKNT